MLTARPSVRDVAVKAGVSVGTVSHVLNHPGRVAAPTRKRVEAAIAELGFVRSETARRLREGVSSLVGVVILDVSNPFFTEAARGIEDKLREVNCAPMICSSDSDARRERDIMRLLASMDVRGVIITPSQHTLDNLPILSDRGLPVVLMNHPPISPGLSSVSSDDVVGARSAMSHLLALGHRRIGFINGPLSLQQAVDRRDGVLSALEQHGEDPARVLCEIEATANGHGFSADAGEIGAAALLDENPQLTALFCANDQMAIGAMREVRRRGLAIPEDIAIVGYDDVAIAAELITPLTTVRQPMREIGEASARLLLEHENDVQHVVFEPELVVRESTIGKN